MKKFLLWTLIVLVVLAIVFFVMKAMSGDAGIKVAVDKTYYRDITELVSASGKVYPEIEVKVSSDVSGEVTELLVKEGDTVKKGQVVARIYADIYNSSRQRAEAIVDQQQASVDNSRASIASYKAQLDQAEAAFNREKTLLDEKVVSRSEFETTQSQYLTAQANYNAALQNVRSGQAGVISARASLTEADKDLSRTIILAPMDGLVSLLSVKKGERVVGTAQMAGTEMMRVADMSQIEVQVDVGENDIPKVRIGDSAQVEVDAYNNRKFRGVVTQIANGNAALTSSVTTTTSNTDVTNYKVHVRLIPSSYKDLIVPHKSFPFRPGMSASADIETRSKTHVLAVPILSVTTAAPEGLSAKTQAAEKKELAASRGDDASGAPNDLMEVLFQVRGDTVRRITVTTGIQDNDYIEILSGIQPGDTVVSAPFNAISKELKTGTKIKITPKEKLFEIKD
ncbi:efflux RND transporter periplasmic adaptor subunit [Dinghuibacter silviterrae]|uniref:HlyD family secretion protein n=1 Tax=Dinghuibacter silviterrae TaxID=1539049 RepID=A0A4R8DRN9_9BACT|nr:efflux RND transporter periplasmic adaptor subunit [Dinghuibacter silviterrae]TDX00085.1 HlyD family secretion protein [Dinghuibacter silviterrae]